MGLCTGLCTTVQASSAAPSHDPIIDQGVPLPPAVQGVTYLSEDVTYLAETVTT